MQYKLYYGELEVGDVHLKQSSFPRFLGDIKLCEPLLKSDDPLCLKLREFVDFSKRESQKEEEVEPTPEEEEAQRKGQEKFKEFFDSKEWRVVKGTDNSSEVIYVPFFTHEDNVLWCLSEIKEE